MATVNDPIPDFAGTAYHDGEFIDVTAADLTGTWAVLFFYPADFSYVCPTELGDLADLHDAFAALDVHLYSISTDTHYTHKAWHDTSPTISSIRYPMIGDPSHEITAAFDVLDGDGLARRATFLIDPDGIIQAAEINADGVGRNAAELLRKAKAARWVRDHPGEVCPARWDDGAETITAHLDLIGRI